LHFITYSSYRKKYQVQVSVNEMYILFRVQERLYDEQFLRNLIKV